MIIAVIFCYSILSFFHNKMYRQDTNLIVFDGYGYYLYLPALYIYDDTKEFRFTEEHLAKYKISNHFYQLNQLQGNTRYPLYNIGQSILWTPFFLLSHVICKYCTDYPCDGMSYPYQWGIFLASLFYMSIGLVYLRKLLRLFFQDHIVALAIFFILFATNYYYYMIYGKEMTHIYLFSLYAMLICFLHQYHINPERRLLLKIMLISGMMILIRSSEVVLFLILFFYRLDSFTQFRKNLQLCIQVLIGAFIIYGVQLLFYKVNYGKWWLDGYPMHHFDLTNPKINYCLFSPVKGWLVYSPIILFVFIGMMMKNRYQKLWGNAIVIFTMLNAYLLFSWSDYTYGYTFGCRPVVQSYALLSLPLSVFIDRVLRSKTLLKCIVGIIMFLLVGLNLFQTHKFVNSIIPVREISWSFYWNTFFKSKLGRKDFVSLPIEEKFTLDRYRLETLQMADSLMCRPYRSPNDNLYTGLSTIKVTQDNLTDYSLQWLRCKLNLSYYGDQYSEDNMMRLVIDCLDQDRHLKYNQINIPILIDNVAYDSLEFFIRNPKLDIGNDFKIYIMNSTPDSMMIHRFTLEKVIEARK